MPPVKDAKFSVRDDYERTIEKVEQLNGGQVYFTELIRAMVDLRLGRCSVLDKDSSIEKDMRCAHMHTFGTQPPDMHARRRLGHRSSTQSYSRR